MLGRRRLSVTASLLTACPARRRSQGVVRASTGTIEASRREANRTATPPGRILGIRLARRAIAEAARGAS